MRDFAPALVEVQRPAMYGWVRPGARLSGLLFATKARSAGDPGLCKSTTVWIPHDPTPQDDPITTEVVYKVVSDPKPLPDMWNDAYGAELDARCARAGRVLPSEDTAFGDERFFSVEMEGGVSVWLATRALQLALQRASSHPDEVSCSTNIPDGVASCRPELLARKTLKLERLLSVTAAPCRDGAASCYLISGDFLDRAEGNSQFHWRLSLRAIIPDTSATGDVKAISALALESGVTIFG